MADGAGYCNALDTPLDTMRGTPFNMKCILGSSPQGTNNVLELVYASATLNISTGQAEIPDQSWRLVEGEIAGFPPSPHCLSCCAGPVHVAAWKPSRKPPSARRHP